MRRHGGGGARARFLLVLMLSVSGGALAQAQPQTPPADAPAATRNAAQGATERPAADDDPQQIKLPNVNVQGKRNVFNDNDKRIKDLQESLPCTGCDAKPHTKKKLVKRLLDAVGDRVLPTQAPDHSDRDASDRAKEFSQENTCTAGNVAGCVPDNLKP